MIVGRYVQLMRVEAIPSSLTAEERLVYLTGAVARARTLLRYTLVQTTVRMHYGVRDRDPGDMSWPELVDLANELATLAPEEWQRVGAIDSLVAVTMALDAANVLLDGLWSVDAQDPEVWTFAGSSYSIQARLGHETSSAQGFVDVVNALSVALMRVAAIQLLVPTPAELPADFLADQRKLLEGRFTQNGDGSVSYIDN